MHFVNFLISFLQILQILLESIFLKFCSIFVNVQLHKTDIIHGFHNYFAVLTMALMTSVKIDDFSPLTHVFSRVFKSCSNNICWWFISSYWCSVSWKIRKVDHHRTLKPSWSNRLWIFFCIDHNAYIESCIRTLIEFLSILVLL